MKKFPVILCIIAILFTVAGSAHAYTLTRLNNASQANDTLNNIDDELLVDFRVAGDWTITNNGMVGHYSNGLFDVTTADSAQDIMIATTGMGILGQTDDQWFADDGSIGRSLNEEEEYANEKLRVTVGDVLISGIMLYGVNSLETVLMYPWVDGVQGSEMAIPGSPTMNNTNNTRYLWIEFGDDELLDVDTLVFSLQGSNPNQNDRINGFQVVAFTGEIAAAPVPEPATMLLLGSGLIGIAAVGRRKFFKK
jgi:hypothetical protein